MWSRRAKHICITKELRHPTGWQWSTWDREAATTPATRVASFASFSNNSKIATVVAVAVNNKGDGLSIVPTRSSTSTVFPMSREKSEVKVRQRWVLGKPSAFFWSPGCAPPSGRASPTATRRSTTGSRRITCSLAKASRLGNTIPSMR